MVTLRRCLVTENARVICMLPRGPVPGDGSGLYQNLFFKLKKKYTLATNPYDSQSNAVVSICSISGS